MVGQKKQFVFMLPLVPETIEIEVTACLWHTDFTFSIAEEDYQTVVTMLVYKHILKNRQNIIISFTVIGTKNATTNNDLI